MVGGGGMVVNGSGVCGAHKIGLGCGSLGLGVVYHAREKRANDSGIAVLFSYRYHGL